MSTSTRARFMILAVFMVACHMLAIAVEPTFPFATLHNGRLHPIIVRGAMGTLVTTFSTPITGGYRIGAAVSDDNGRSWRVIDSVSLSRAGMFGLQRRPTVHQTSNGTLVCSYEDQKVGDVMPKVYVTRSTDNGNMWSTTVRAVRGPQAKMQDFSSMAVGSNGLVVISFIAADSSEAGQHMWIIRSTDHGATWSMPIRVNRKGWIGRACECCMTGVAIAPDGTVGVAFRANRSNVRDIHVAFSTDGGLTFADPKLVQDSPWNVQGCPATGPSITFDASSKAHLSWRDVRDTAYNKPIAFYAGLRPTDTTVPVNINLSSLVADEAEYPSVCVSDDGRIIRVVLESSNGLRVSTSVDGGVTFDSRVIDELVKSKASAYIVALPNGRALSTWMSSREGGSYDVIMLNEDAPTSVDDTPTVLPLNISGGWLTLDARASVVACDLAGRSVDVREEVGTVRRIQLSYDLPTLVSVRTATLSTVYLVDRSTISVSVKR